MTENELGPFLLEPWFSERPWGRRDLQPWYAADVTARRVEPVGEAWLTGPQSVVVDGPMGKMLAEVASNMGDALLGPSVEAGEFPLLVKLLFPSDKLSVQVHPDDAQAQAMGVARGKTECWYVLEAEPGAAVALGMKAGATKETIRAAIGDGTMEQWMEWLPVVGGDMVFVDAGTVHAIGPGVVLLETQQTCDVTFRMYDYGRPRELHVEQALGVMKTKTAAGKIAPKPMDGFVRLIEQRYFVVDRYELEAGAEVRIPIAEAGCVVGLKGEGVVAGTAGEAALRASRATVIPAACGEVTVSTRDGVSFARCWEPVR